VAFLAVFLALPDRLDYSSAHYFTLLTESLLACFSRARRFPTNPLELPLSGNEEFRVDSLLSYGTGRYTRPSTQKGFSHFGI
jgi:hypothetical protein